MRPIGASELHPDVQTTLETKPAARGGDRKVSVQVRNYGAARTCARRVARPRRPDDPASLPHDRARPGRGDRDATAIVAEPALWSPASPNLYTLQLAVPGESSYSARVGLRQLSWHGRDLYLNGQRLQLHGATIQEDAPGHGDALTPADQDGIVAELKAIGANAVRAQHPLDPGAARTARRRRDPRVAGIGPVEGAGTGTRHAARCSPKPSSRRAPRCSPPQLHPSIFAWNLVDEVAENGRNAAEVRYVQRLAPLAARARPGPHGRGRHLGRPPARACRRDLLRKSTRSPRRTTPAGTTRPTTARAQLAARDARAPGGNGADVRGQGAGDQRVRRRIEHAQPARRAPAATASSRAAGAPHRGLRRRPAAQRRCSSGCCATTRSRRPSRAARSTACCRT